MGSRVEKYNYIREIAFIPVSHETYFLSEFRKHPAVTESADSSFDGESDSTSDRSSQNQLSCICWAITSFQVISLSVVTSVANASTHNKPNTSTVGLKSDCAARASNGEGI